jgi:adenylate kinase
MGIVGCGGVAAIVYFFVSGASSKKGDIMNALHKLFQKKSQENIAAIEEKQSKVKVNIDHKEKLAKENKERIKDIQKKAAEEIEEVLKKDRIDAIHDEIDRDWEDL